MIIEREKLQDYVIQVAAGLASAITSYGAGRVINYEELAVDAVTIVRAVLSRLQEDFYSEDKEYMKFAKD